MRLVARFLGMFGPQGALPLTTTEESYHLASGARRRVSALRRYFPAALSRACFFAPGPIRARSPRTTGRREDRFLAYIGSMIGVGSPPYRNVDSISDFAKMEFAGLIAPKAKSASRLRGMIAGLFGVRSRSTNSSAPGCRSRRRECTQLGASQSRLGSDVILGSSVFSVSDKFRIRVFVKDIAQYERFLPGSDLARQVGDAVFLYLGEEFDWDMELAIPAGEITPVRLGRGAKLGWTSWMAPNWSKTDQTIRTDARFHVVSRMSARSVEAAETEHDEGGKMGADISVESVTGKLNRVGYEAFIQALRQAKSAGNRNIELGHWMLHLLQKDRTDLALTADHFKLDRAKLLARCDGDSSMAFARTKRKCRAFPIRSPTRSIAAGIMRRCCSARRKSAPGILLVADAQIARICKRALAQCLGRVLEDFGRRTRRRATASIWAESEEGNLRPMDGSGLAAAGADGTSAAPGRQRHDGARPLQPGSDRQGRNRASMDPILGRDEEIRQIVDVLMRRRQNNPILTGEAGVGKTAVVEGFAQRIASGDVPPPLRGVKLCALDVGLMQAGASMKGEFEQRLRSVIDEVQSSPTPIILFIDEAHTLIGAGGAAGTGDAANLLKPALARGTLRTIAATTFAEYRQYFEKDPALTRRFQPIQIGEPDVATRGDHAARPDRADGEASQGARFRRRDRLRRAILASLYSRPPASRQGGQPAGHRLRARRDQPDRQAGGGRGRAGAHRRARTGERGAGCANATLARPTRSASPKSTLR